MYTFTHEQIVELLAWAKELETTQAKQAYGALHNENGEFCCLGLRLNMVDCTKWDTDASEEGIYIWRYSTCNTATHAPYRERANSYVTVDLPLEQATKLFGDYTSILEPHFITLNDGLKYTFKHIAQEVYNLVDCKDFTDETLKLLEISRTVGKV